MPIPLAVAAFCISAAACDAKKKRIGGDQFVSSPCCGLFVQEVSHPFVVGAVDMSQFIQSNIGNMPAVKDVSVRAENGRVQVEVTVDEFDWEKLKPIYDKELDLSYIFRNQAIDFRVIDDSPQARSAAHAG